MCKRKGRILGEEINGSRDGDRRERKHIDRSVLFVSRCYLDHA